MRITVGFREATGKGFASLSGLTGTQLFIEVERRGSPLANWQPEYEAMKASMDAIHAMAKPRQDVGVGQYEQERVLERVYEVADRALAAAGDD